jgi:peptide/nickel transport system permease protein
VGFGAFLARRLAALAATLLATSFIVYGAVYLAPGSPLTAVTGGRPLPPTTLKAISHQYGFDKPFLVRYWDWLTGILHGDFGQSVVSRQDVSSLITPRVGTTVFLIAYAAFLILLFGVALGLVSALRKGHTDTVILATTSVGTAIPSFVAAIVLIWIFALKLGWLPALGGGSGFADQLRHLTMPAVALALSGVAYVARLTRAAANDELRREHVETARGRGIPERYVVQRHVLRNALVPITTAAGLTIAGLIAGTVVVENAFALNGLGSFLVQAVGQKDVPVVQAICLILVAAFIIVNTIVDLLYAVIDPRISFGGGGDG